EALGRDLAAQPDDLAEQPVVGGGLTLEVLPHRVRRRYRDRPHVLGGPQQPARFGVLKQGPDLGGRGLSRPPAAPSLEHPGRRAGAAGAPGWRRPARPEVAARPAPSRAAGPAARTFRWRAGPHPTRPAPAAAGSPPRRSDRRRSGTAGCRTARRVPARPRPPPSAPGPARSRVPRPTASGRPAARRPR